MTSRDLKLLFEKIHDLVINREHAPICPLSEGIKLFGLSSTSGSFRDNCNHRDPSREILVANSRVFGKCAALRVAAFRLQVGEQPGLLPEKVLVQGIPIYG